MATRDVKKSKTAKNNATQETVRERAKKIGFKRVKHAELCLKMY